MYEFVYMNLYTLICMENEFYIYKLMCTNSYVQIHTYEIV
jgi:hypothetical protein